MKNLFKVFEAMRSIAIIAIVAVIGFWAISCGDNDGGGGGGNAISGNTIVTGTDVEYDSSIENIAEAKNITDFNLYDVNNVGLGIKPLNYFLDGSPSITVENNKVKIILGTPKSDFLINISELPVNPDITVNPSNVKAFGGGSFFTSDRKYVLVCMNDDNDIAQLSYFDKDVTIKGTSYDEAKNKTYNINWSLKKGWNYITNTDSYTTLPSGYKWTVVDVYWDYIFD
jgi:hypothetical protein